METRVVEEVRVYVLVCNPVTDRAEEGHVCAISTNYDALVRWYREQLAAEPYRDGSFLKRFRRNSDLEWYNPIRSSKLNAPDPFGHGIKDQWVKMDDLHKLRHRFTFVEE